MILSSGTLDEKSDFISRSNVLLSPDVVESPWPVRSRMYLTRSLSRNLSRYFIILYQYMSPHSSLSCLSLLRSSYLFPSYFSSSLLSPHFRSLFISISLSLSLSSSPPSLFLIFSHLAPMKWRPSMQLCKQDPSSTLLWQRTFVPAATGPLSQPPSDVFLLIWLACSSIFSARLVNHKF